MDNDCNRKESNEPKEPCKRKKEKEKAFKQALQEGMDRYDEALRHLANR